MLFLGLAALVCTHTASVWAIGTSTEDCGSAGDESSLLAFRSIRRSAASQVPGEAVLPGAAESPEEVESTDGTNLENNYTYRFSNDCYSQNYTCPEGQWCQVEVRKNWYPWDVSYMNRGRCLNYTPIGGACEAAFPGKTSFPRKEDGGFFTRPVLCGPPGKAICTGTNFAKVLPPTCVRQRDPRGGCMSSRPFCAGRPPHECPPREKDFCVCPRRELGGTDSPHSSCTSESVVSRRKLEQCGQIFSSFNGPNFAFQFQGNGSEGLPSDANIEAAQQKVFQKLALQHGIDSGTPNDFLRVLWPYPVCAQGEDVAQHCTRFPLPTPPRDDDGGLIHSHKFSFIPKHGSGVTDYHCAWMVMHTLSFNGPAVLTVAEQTAFAEMILYVSGQFDCKVCRNHFVHIIEMFGMPTGPLRQTYAEWLWRAHNIANEHTYATHSPSNQQISELRLEASDRRWNMWAAPQYMHPWYMSFEDAQEQWTTLDGERQTT